MSQLSANHMTARTSEALPVSVTTEFKKTKKQT